MSSISSPFRSIFASPTVINWIGRNQILQRVVEAVHELVIDPKALRLGDECLPEIIGKILLTLPRNEYLKCRLVCKKWNLAILKSAEGAVAMDHAWKESIDRNFWLSGLYEGLQNVPFLCLEMARVAFLKRPHASQLFLGLMNPKMEKNRLWQPKLHSLNLETQFLKLQSQMDPAAAPETLELQLKLLREHFTSFPLEKWLDFARTVQSCQPMLFQGVLNQMKEKAQTIKADFSLVAIALFEIFEAQEGLNTTLKMILPDVRTILQALNERNAAGEDLNRIREIYSHVKEACEQLDNRWVRQLIIMSIAEDELRLQLFDDAKKTLVLFKQLLHLPLYTEGPPNVIYFDHQIRLQHILKMVRLELQLDPESGRRSVENLLTNTHFNSQVYRDRFLAKMVPLIALYDLERSEVMLSEMMEMLPDVLDHAFGEEIIHAETIVLEGLADSDRRLRVNSKIKEQIEGRQLLIDSGILAMRRVKRVQSVFLNRLPIELSTHYLKWGIHRDDHLFLAYSSYLNWYDRDFTFVAKA